MTTLKEEPLKFNRHFAANFRYDEDTNKYVPTMACIDSKDKHSLKVHNMTRYMEDNRILVLL